jgi:hypothetical protein
MEMKQWIILLAIAVTLTSCNRSTCPAYMNGAVTGVEGSREKPHPLFPEKMKKKKKHH